MYLRLGLENKRVDNQPFGKLILLHPNKTKTVQTVVVFNIKTVSKIPIKNISTLNAKTVETTEMNSVIET